MQAMAIRGSPSVRTSVPSSQRRMAAVRAMPFREGEALPPQPLRPHPHGQPIDPKAEQVLEALEQRHPDNVDEARGLTEEVPQRAPSKPHSNDQAGYHSGDSASLQAVNAQVSAAHRATHPAPDAPPGQLPYSGPTGQTLYHANEAASLQATDKQVAAAHRAHYAGGLGADPVSAPSHAQAAREGPGKAPLAAPYSRDGGPYAVHRGALGGLEGVHGNATRGPMGGEGDAEERSRRSGSEGQVRAAEGALSGSTKANTGDDLTRRMEVWAHEHAPAGSAHTEHAGAESAHLTGAESAHHAHADDLHGQGAGIVRSAKGAIKTGATMAKNAVGHISDDVKELLEHEEQPRDEIM